MRRQDFAKPDGCRLLLARRGRLPLDAAQRGVGIGHDRAPRAA